MAKLGEVCKVAGSSKEISENQIWLLNLDAIEQRTGKVLTYNYVDQNELNGSIIQFDADNVLYSKLRPNLNKVVLPNQQGFATSEMLPLKPDKSVLCKEYLAAYLRSDSFVAWAVSKTAGAKMPRLSTNVLLGKEIPLPPLDEQRRIAAVLDNVSDLIAKRREQLDKLDELVKAWFVEMFGDPLLDSGKYPKVPLGSLAEVGSSKRIFEKEYVSEGVPFYRTKEIVELSKGNRITTELFITRERYDEIRREYGVPQTGDLLISAVGTIGVIWIVDGKNDFYFKDGNLLRVATSEKFVPIYLKYLLESLIGAYKLEMSSGTAYAALTISAMKEILVYEVPLAEQKQFATFVKQIDKSKLTIQQSLDRMEVLKKALMQQYFG